MSEDLAASLKQAHAMIGTLADHCTTLAKRLDAHERQHAAARVKMSGHDDLHNSAARQHAALAERVGKLERAGAERGQSGEAQPVYKADVNALAKNFRDGLRARRRA